MLVVYFLTNWLPIPLHSTWHSLGETSLLLSLFRVGSPFGSLTVSFLMDRYSRHLCMVVSAFIAAVCLVVIGNVVSDLLPAAVVSMAVGTGRASRPEEGQIQTSLGRSRELFESTTAM
ncbi:MFS transporter [Paraburkholderia bryophila]|uniref:MFS transporter n=1 Tax=Paraburkholderia bryophila TaxID=420952 RepID=UPI0015C897DD